MTDQPTGILFSFFSQTGSVLLIAILATSTGTAISGFVNFFSNKPVWQKSTMFVLSLANILFFAGFLLTCWFHYQIYNNITLELPSQFVPWLNNQLSAMNAQSAYGLPLYDPNNPPRYMIPVWIENEKYFFWFMCFSFMAQLAHLRIRLHRFRAFLHVLVGCQAIILFFFADPFAAPLPQYFSEIAPWFQQGVAPINRIGLFMKLYPKLIFYYNASYMWFHPPLLFISYACITITFVTSVFMLSRRELIIESLGYDFAKLGYFVLTLGMLLGYPWALKAWGPNWWWDPKICSSIMMWAIYSTYLHTRLYANKPGMWYFTSTLGILCFLAMLFTFLTSFFFPGEHTFQ